MCYLIDTHILLWSLFDPDKLKKKTKNALLDQTKQVLVSTISFWEISLKYSLGKLELSGDVKPDDLVESCTESGFDILELDPATMLTYYRLPKTTHKDPFDRLLIWQAIRNDMVFISQDKSFKLYNPHGLRTI